MTLSEIKDALLSNDYKAEIINDVVVVKDPVQCSSGRIFFNEVKIMDTKQLCKFLNDRD